MFINQKNILIRRIHKLSNSLWYPINLNNNVFNFNEYNKPIHNLNKFYNLNDSWFDNEFLLNSDIKNNYEPNNSQIPTCKITKTIKVVLKPNNNQIKLINEYFDIYRYFYNRTIDFIEHKKQYNYKIVKRDFKTVKFTFDESTKKYNLSDNDMKKFIIPDWVVNKNIPKRIISNSIIDCCNAYKSNLSKLKNKSITKFKMNYKTKKDNINCLNITKDCFSKDNSLFSSFLGKGKNKLKGFYYTTKHKWFLLTKNEYTGNPKSRIKINIDNININQDCRLNLINNKYILFIPITVDSNKCINDGIISLDSGIKTFQTGFSNKNYCIKIGNEPINKLNKYKNKCDRLKSLIDTITDKSIKNKLQEKLKITNLTIRNKIDDLHWKTINYLTTTHSHIILCDFQTKSISSKAYKTTNRNLYLLSHYKFKLRLQYKCKANGCKLDIVNESYTSKLCSKCGYCKDNLKLSRVYKCNECKSVIDRDINGARNIYINYLGSE